MKHRMCKETLCLIPYLLLHNQVHYPVVATSGIGPIQRDVYFSGLGFLKKRIS